MAGAGAAYLRLKEPDDKISQSLQFWGAQQNKIGEEVRKRNDENQDKIRLINKDFETQHGYKFDDFKAELSGFDSYDQIQSDYVYKEATEKYIELYRQGEAALQRGDIKGKKEAEMQMMKVKGTIKQLKEANTSLADIYKNYVDMANKGEIWEGDADNFEAIMQSVMQDKNVKFKLDEKNNLIALGIKKNTDGSEEPFTVPISQVIDKSFRPYQKYEVNGTKGIATNILNSLGSYEEQKQKGMYTVKSTLWNDNLEKAAKAQIAGIVNGDETMANMLSRFKEGGSNKRTGFTEEEKSFVADKLLEVVRGGYKEKYQEDFDKDLASYKLGTATLAETIRKNKAAEANQRAQNAINLINARATELNAKTNAKKVENDIKLANNPVESFGSEPFTMTVQENGKIKPKEFKTFTLRDSKSGNGKDFVTGVYRDKNGKPVYSYTPSVSMSADKTLITYKDGDETVVINRKKDKAMFELLEGQLSGRMDYTAEGADMGGTSTSASPEDLMRQYGIE